MEKEDIEKFIDLAFEEALKALKNNETGYIEYRLPIIEKKRGNKNDLIFFVLLFTYCLIFLRYKKND